MKTGRFIFLFFTCIWCISTSVSFAQIGYNKDSLISSKIADLNVFWKKYNDLTSNKSKFEDFSIIPNVYDTKTIDAISRVDYLNKVNEAKIALLKKDIGLDLVANYVENFDPQPSEDNLVYKRRIAAGLDWNILSDVYVFKVI